MYKTVDKQAFEGALIIAPHRILLFCQQQFIHKREKISPTKLKKPGIIRFVLSEPYDNGILRI
uniref:Uncharacterized protein n=1 Tax=uncultured bacterium contig00025 TaxID=1181514 RepID=A0A806K1H9_9BACT|nr:hypothetical protein [uncultured bacterium contig00025]